MKEKTNQGKRTQARKKNVFDKWKENLFDWKEWRGENHDLVSLNLQAGWKKLCGRVRGLWQGDPHPHQEHRVFPESESRLGQSALFLVAGVRRRGISLKEKLHLRRKDRAYSQAARRGWFEEIRLHPVLFLLVAVSASALAAGLSLYTHASVVSYDGVELGGVSNVRIVSAAVENIEAITRETLGDQEYTVDLSRLKRDGQWIPRRELESRQELEDQLSAQLGEVTYAYVLYVNDEPIAATTFPGALEELLEQLKNVYRTADTVDLYFEESVEIRQEYVESSRVMNLGHIARIMNETKAGEVTYTVKSGDAPSTIAEDAGLSLSELQNMNRGYDWSVLHVGDVLTISNAVPYLTVVNVERQNYVQDVPYGVEYIDDDSMYQGDYKVLSPGQFGKADITANVTYVNGVESGRQIVANVILIDPVTEQQARGTIPRPSWFPTGSFRWPCNGILTSRFGHRNTGIPGATTNHQGIDIANSSGTPIYAADGGTVVTAGWGGSSWGYLVTIDHGNGYMTYYGHNSKVIVRAGDHVYKGQQISLMGSTGVSSGPHCHFGVKLNGTFVNPLNYL